MAVDLLEALVSKLNAVLQTVLRSACDEGESWLAVMVRGGLPPGGPTSAPGSERAAELRQVLAALIAEAAAALDRLEGQPGVEASRVAGIRQRLETLVEHETQRYLEAVAAAGPPRPSSGIASIFQNAVVTSRLSPWAHLEWDRRLTVICRTCGAPQLKQQEFRCEFCGSDMFAREEG